MIEAYRLLMGMEGVHYYKFFQLSPSHAAMQGGRGIQGVIQKKLKNLFTGERPSRETGLP